MSLSIFLGSDEGDNAEANTARFQSWITAVNQHRHISTKNKIYAKTDTESITRFLSFLKFTRDVEGSKDSSRCLECAMPF